jgi:hypothetical protein
MYSVEMFLRIGVQDFDLGDPFVDQLANLRRRFVSFWLRSFMRLVRLEEIQKNILQNQETSCIKRKTLGTIVVSKGKSSELSPGGDYVSCR